MLPKRNIRPATTFKRERWPFKAIAAGGLEMGKSWRFHGLSAGALRDWTGGGAAIKPIQSQSKSLKAMIKAKRCCIWATWSLHGQTMGLDCVAKETLPCQSRRISA